jgi:hypothetical protein
MPGVAVAPSFIVVEANNATHVWFEHHCRGEMLGNSLPNMIWHITSREPLSVTPSIHCQQCGLHGWIKEGMWVAV